MFNATEVERKTREFNILMDMQINLSSYRTSGHYLSLSLHRQSWNSLGTKNVSSTHGEIFLKGKQITTREKMRQKTHRVYPPERLQTSLLARLQKKSLEHNGCFSDRNRESENHQWTISLVCKTDFKQIVEVLFQCF